MVSTDVSKSHVSVRNPSSECFSSTTTAIPVNARKLAIRVEDMAAYGDTPSPSSIGSTSAVENSPKYRQPMLSSTLKIKDDQRLKHRSRYSKLFRKSQAINRQYMMAMTNILFRMQKELYQLRRRTHRVERSIVEQGITEQPTIRIARLTQDQLSTICLDETDDAIEDNHVSSDQETLSTSEQTPEKPTRDFKGRGKYDRKSKKRTKRPRRRIWMNNRQRSIDPKKYCTLCRREFSKPANFLLHVNKIHQGIVPPPMNNLDESIEDTSELVNNEQNSESEITQAPSEALVISCENEQVPVDKQSGVKSTMKSPRQLKLKCGICGKFFRADYLKRHQQRIHREQEVSSTSRETNNDTDERSVSIEKSLSDSSHPSTANPPAENQHGWKNDKTPTAITVVEMVDNDEPIRLPADSAKTIVLAVTCLEAYQLELVEQFLEKFSSQVCQTTAIDARTTHLITNDEQQTSRSPLSMKLIEAIAHHCFCVSFRWILDCLKYDRIVDEVSYEIEGDNTETLPHQGPRRSRLMSTRHSLFSNVCFMIKCTENFDIRMTNERLEDLITTCGGQIITCVTQRLLDKYQIVVLCDMVYVSERRHNYEQCRSLGIHFVSSDWVLESILEYRQKPFFLFEEVPL